MSVTSPAFALIARIHSAMRNGSLPYPDFSRPSEAALGATGPSSSSSVSSVSSVSSSSTSSRKESVSSDSSASVDRGENDEHRTSSDAISRGFQPSRVGKREGKTGSRKREVT